MNLSAVADVEFLKGVKEVVLANRTSVDAIGYSSLEGNIGGNDRAFDPKAIIGQNLSENRLT